MKPSRLLALATCAFAFWATSCPAAGESISINVQGRNIASILESDGSSGYVSVANANWNEINVSGSSVTVNNLKLNDGTTRAISMTATSGGSWSYDSTGAFGAMGRGYADGDWTIQLANIPFSSYEVILYMATDWSARWGAVGVQLATEEAPTYYAYPLVDIDSVTPLTDDAIYAVTSVTTDDGTSAITATSTWGKSRPSTHGYGVDVMRIGSLSGSNITITTKGDSGASGNDYSTAIRSGLYGFQIVNTGDVLTATNYTAQASGTAVTFSNITWAEGTLTAGAFNEATLTLEPGSTLTFTEAVPTLLNLKLVSTGKVTLAVSGEGVTLDTALANVANFDFSGVTELDIGALTANAMTIPEGVTLTMNAPGQVTTLTRTAGSSLKLTGDRSGTHSEVLVLQNDTALETVGNLTISDDVSDTLNGRTWTLSGGTSTVTGGLYTRSSTTDNGWMSPGQTSFFTMKDGATLTVESASSTLGQNRSDGAVMFAECGGGTSGLSSAVVSISGTGTRLSVPNGAVNLSRDGTATVTISDGATLEAYKLGNLKNNSTLTVQTGATLTLGKADATDSVLKVTAGSVTLADGAILSAKSDWSVDSAAVANAIAITGALTVKPEGHTITLRQTSVSEGSSLALVGTGVLDLSALGKNLPKIASLEAGTTLRVAPFSQSELLAGGNFSASLPLADGATLSGTIEYLDGATWKTATVTTDGTTATISGTITATPTLTGSSWWWDYEFNGELSNSGRDNTPLNDDSQGTTYNDDNTALMLKSTPHRGVTGGYPAAVTAVFYGTAGTTAHGGILAFGTRAGGAISLVGGDNPSAGQMRLIYSVGSTVTELVVMNVPNATTANHLYAFTKRSEAGKTVVDIYLDGKVLTKYTFDREVSLGAGFQVGSLHGGTIAGHIVKCADNAGTVDFLRVADEALTPAAIKAMATAYPYVSTKGTATRTVSTATATWEDGTNAPWSQAMPNTATAAQAAPNAGTNVVLSASTDTTITLNGTSAVTYESMTFTGSGAVTLSATETSATMLASNLTVSTNLTVPAHCFTAGTVTVDEGKTLTFDCSGLDGWKETYVLTGYVEPEVAERIAVANTEIAGSPFTYEKAQDSAGSVILRATASTKPLMATVPVGEVNFSALNWTMEGQPSTPDWSKTSALSATLTLSGDATLTFDQDSAVAVKELILAGTGTLTLQKAASAAAFTSQTTRVNTSVNVAAGALSLGNVVLGPNVSLTLNESTYNLTTVSAAETVVKATRPTVILASDCTLAVPQALSSAHHNFNLTIAENTTCTTSGRWDICGSTLTVAGTLQKTDALWLGVSYSSLDAADSALIVTSTGEVQVSGPFYIGAWGNTSLNTVTVEGRCTLNTVQCHAASTVGFSVKENGVLTVNNTTVNNTNAVANVAVEQGGTLAWKGNITGSLTFADGAKLDVANGTLSTGTVTIAESGTVTVTGATTAGTPILTCQNPEALLAQLTGAPKDCFFAANAEKTAVVLAVEIPTVPGESGNKVELSANSKSVLQAVAADNSLPSVTEVSGSTTVNGTPTTLTAEAIDNALAVFGESVVSVAGTELKVDYNFGIVAVEPSYLQGNLSMLTVKVKVTTADGTLASLADGATLELVDGTTVLLDVGAGFSHLTTGEYAGYFYPVDTVRVDGQTAKGLIGRSFKVRAKKE